MGVVSVATALDMGFSPVWVCFLLGETWGVCVVLEGASFIVSMILRSPLAMSVKAWSRFDHAVTAFPPVGRACSLPKGAVSQSHGRKIIGRTRASPATCLSIALCISIL